MHMGQVFAVLVPKDRVAAKYRGYPLQLHNTDPHRFSTFRAETEASTALYNNNHQAGGFSSSYFGNGVAGENTTTNNNEYLDDDYFNQLTTFKNSQKL